MQQKTSDQQPEGEIERYARPGGGWGSARAVAEILARERLSPAAWRDLITKHNKTGGYMCVSCAWAKPARPHPLEFCESGAKATAWELTAKRIDPEFFSKRMLGELETWSDHDLEEAGRLTHPLRWERSSNKYVPVSWEDALQEIGRELRALDPNSVVFYTSGRASLETSYMYQLFARLYGTNNLPDSSNMCHESSSVALPETLGVSVGTASLDDFGKCDAIFFIAQNVGTSSPRLLHSLEDAAKRGVPIVTFNPLREPALETFVNPQSPTEMAVEMAAGKGTKISSQYHQVKSGGDIAALTGICKTLFAMDDAAKQAGQPPVVDRPFIDEHTHGFDAFEAFVRGADWRELERRSGLTRDAMEAAGTVYARAKAALLCYGMGLTQQIGGVDNVHMLTNLLLIRGNIGKPGAGLCAIRGHSNVQGQRTVGITEKPKLAPLDQLKELYKFEPPREKGYDTVEACQAMIEGRVRAFVSLGGNFVRAIPDTRAMEAAWRKLRLTVMVATKLNRSQVLHGEIAFILPCLGRIEVDRQASGPQAVSVEDSTAHFHGSRGLREPASEHLRSEPWIVAQLAKATLSPNPNVHWDGWVENYDRVRDAIEATYPDIFRDFNRRMWEPGGFPRPLAAKERKWNTKTGKANFKAPSALTAAAEIREDDRETLQLITLRSNDQFNTTIYGYHDRYRGVHGTRMVLFLSPHDMDRFGLHDDETVGLRCAVDDGVTRQVDGLRVMRYDIPVGCCASYYPECNPLIPLSHHAKESHVPAAKAVPVRIVRNQM